MIIHGKNNLKHCYNTFKKPDNIDLFIGMNTIPDISSGIIPLHKHCLEWLFV